jgi:hypothetical protein
MAWPRIHVLILIALLVVGFGLATRLAPEFQAWRGSRAAGDFFKVALGESRRMFANSFYVKADEYYHSGYYPSMFDDNTAFQTTHMAEDTGAVHSRNQGDEHGFLGPVRNWINGFGRHFIPNRHTHLDEGGPADNLGSSDKVREILPWLKLSADLDPDNVETYTVTAYWLRQRMNNVAEADAVLHEGLRNCPGSYDILFELGRLYDESYHDRARARNVWEEAVRQWFKLDPAVIDGKTSARDLVAAWLKRPDKLTDAEKDQRLILEQLTTHLAKLEEETGHLTQAIQWLKAAHRVSATPNAVQKRIDELNLKLGQELNPLLKPLY